MNKSPAFQFYPDDYMGGKPGMMTPEQTHVYIWLLCLDWNQGGFVLDIPNLSRWCRVSPSVFRKVWGVVQECFDSKEGKWFNQRLEKERNKQAEWREKSAKGGRSKKQPPLNNASDLTDPLVETKREPKGNTPVSVTSFHTPVIPPKPPKGLSSDEQVVLDHFLAKHPRRRTEPKKAKRYIGAALKHFTVDQLKQAIDGNASDPWHIKTHKHELAYVLRDQDKISEFIEKSEHDPDEDDEMLQEALASRVPIPFPVERLTNVG